MQEAPGATKRRQGGVRPQGLSGIRVRGVVTNSLVVAMLVIVSPTGLRDLSASRFGCAGLAHQGAGKRDGGRGVDNCGNAGTASVTMFGLLRASDGMFRLPAKLSTPAVAVKVTPNVHLASPANPGRGSWSNHASVIWKSGEGEMLTGPLGFAVL